MAGALGEDDLFLGALDDGGGVEVEGFLELLAGYVGELGVGDEGLGFGADELLFEGDEFGGFGFFVLELLDLVLDLQGALVRVRYAGCWRCGMHTFCLLVLVGCTLASTLRICFSTPLLSSKF